MIKLRPVKKEHDITSVSALAYEIWREYYYPIIGMDQTEYMLEKFQSSSAIKKNIEEGYEYFMIRELLVPIGYVAICKNNPPSELFLSKIYIHKDYRQSGYGHTVFEKIQEMAVQARQERIWLTVHKENASINAYEKMGFIREKSINTDIGNGYFMDDYIYGKNI